VVRSGGAGRAWPQLKAPGSMQAECFADARDGWVARAGSVWTTQDAGASWTRTNLQRARQGFPVPELGCRGRDVWVVFHEGAAAGTEGYRVYRSLDSGSSWRAVCASPFQNRLPSISNYAGPFSILGLETSCDETAAALITHDGRILSNVVSSQADLHARYGGVVPEVASRRHLELVTPVLREALGEAGAELDDVELLGVTTGPGLIGALLVGVSAAKAIAWARRLPLAAIDHLHGHVASLYLEPDPLEPPFLCLLASGGHTL